MVLHSQVEVNGRGIGMVEIRRIFPGGDGKLPREGVVCRYRWEVVVGARGELDRLVARGELEHPYSYAQGAWMQLYALVIRAAQEQLGLPTAEGSSG